MKYQLKEDAIIKPDGKVVANIKDGVITPTAPVYYKFMDEFEFLVNGPKEEAPEVDDEQPDEEEVAKMIEEANAVVTPSDEAGTEPPRSNMLGQCSPGYPTWLLKTDPERAAKEYEGRNIPEYEEAKKNLGKS